MMLAALKKYGINSIWHFTEHTNLQSIRQYKGLWSFAELRRQHIVIPKPGGNQWSHDADVHKGVDRYVHLAFVNDHPMLFAAKSDQRIKNAVWLKINAVILDHPDVRYTLDVANKSGVPLLTAKEAAEKLDFEVLFTRTNWKDPLIQARRKIAVKSEVLIPKHISSEMILGWENG